MKPFNKTLYEYDSYRAYLRDQFKSEKKSSKKSTSGIFASQLGMSAAAFSMILSGERKLTLEKIHVIARNLNLSEQEQDYFEALVFKEQLKDDPVAVKFYSRRLKQIAKGAPIKRHRTTDKSVVSDWFVPALLIQMIDFERTNNPDLTLARIDFESLGQRFKTSASQMRKLVASLEKSGLLSINTKDQIHIVFDKVLSQFNQKKHVLEIHRELGLRIRDQFELIDSFNRTFTFSMKKTALPELKSDLIALFEKYMATLSDRPEGNEIYQALVGIFPV